MRDSPRVSVFAGRCESLCDFRYHPCLLADWHRPKSTRGWIRTSDLRFRKAPLYPLSYAGEGLATGRCPLTVD